MVEELLQRPTTNWSTRKATIFTCYCNVKQSNVAGETESDTLCLFWPVKNVIVQSRQLNLQTLNANMYLFI